MDSNTIGKPYVFALMFLLAIVLQPLTASAWETVFEIRDRHSYGMDDKRFEKNRALTIPSDSVRIGVELRPGLTIGFDSEHGLGMFARF